MNARMRSAPCSQYRSFPHLCIQSRFPFLFRPANPPKAIPPLSPSHRPHSLPPPNPSVTQSNIQARILTASSLPPYPYSSPILHRQNPYTAPPISQSYTPANQSPAPSADEGGGQQKTPNAQHALPALRTPQTCFRSVGCPGAPAPICWGVSGDRQPPLLSSISLCSSLLGRADCRRSSGVGSGCLSTVQARIPPCVCVLNRRNPAS